MFVAVCTSGKVPRVARAVLTATAVRHSARDAIDPQRRVESNDYILYVIDFAVEFTPLTPDQSTRSTMGPVQSGTVRNIISYNVCDINYETAASGSVTGSKGRWGRVP